MSANLTCNELLATLIARWGDERRHHVPDPATLCGELRSFASTATTFGAHVVARVLDEYAQNIQTNPRAHDGAILRTDATTFAELLAAPTAQTLEAAREAVGLSAPRP